MRHAFLANRRSFLAALAAPHSFSGRSTAVAPARTQAPMPPQEFKQRLRGPIVSIPTPFTSDFKVDYEGTRRIIGRSLAHGIHTFELTFGDSQYRNLAYDEIKDLAAVVADAAGGRSMVIIGSGPWWTGQTVDFARHAQRSGATALEVMLPDNGDEDGYVRHFQEVAKSTRLPLVLRGNLPVPLLERLVQIDSVVAMKQDVSQSYFIETLIHFGGRLNSYSGGSFEWFVTGQPYGAAAYFDTYSTFAPEISVRFWKAVQSNDMAAERDIVEKYDHPLISHQYSDSFWHAALEHFGVAGRYLRPPQHTYNDQEMKKVSAFFDQLGLTPAGGRAPASGLL